MWLIASIVGLAQDAQAQVVNGRAHGIQGDVGLILVPVVTIPPTPEVTLPPGGGTADDSLLNIGLANGVLGTILGSGTATVRTTSAFDQAGNPIPINTGIFSQTEVEDLGIGGLGLLPNLVGASVLSTYCTVGPTGLVGGMGATDLSIAGAAIPVPAVPNLPAIDIDIGLLSARVALNGQVTTTAGNQTTLTVTGIHLEVDALVGVLAGIDLRLFESSCTVTAPTSTSLTPNVGPSAGGTLVTINGTNFLQAASVTFGGVPGTNVTIISDTQLTVLTPAHAPGTVDVAVTTAGGSTLLPSAFTFFPAPTTTSLAPNAGPLGGGQTVVIGGANFTSPSTVLFGANPATVTGLTPTTITVTTPAAAAAGPVSVTVSSAGGTSVPLTYTYLAVPSTLSLNPTQGPLTGGNAVLIIGSNFGNQIPGVAVTFGGQPATVTGVTPTTINVIAPPGVAPGTVNVVVATGGGSSAPLPYNYVAVPTLTAVDPAVGPVAGGNSVTLTGTNFGTDLSGVTVFFGPFPATVTGVSQTQIAATVPAAPSAGATSVTVTTAGGTTAPVAYTYVNGPAIQSIVPNRGPATGGTPVTITGINFQPGATVTFAGAPASSVVVVNSTQITAVTPPGTIGVATVLITSAGGTSTGAFTYVSSPQITSITPNTGEDGTVVDLGGTGFQPGGTVTICGTTVGIVFISPTQVQFVAPVCPAGGPQDVTLSNPDGGTTTVPDGFTYLEDTDDDPDITSITPAEGPPTGGTNVTIRGNDFLPGATVTFDTTAATNVVVVDATTITATTPAHPNGVVDVTVTTSAGTRTLPGGFTYRDGLPPECVETYELDPNDVNGDPDGDGRTNLQECTGDPETHPKGYFTRYLPEGAMNTFFDLRYAVFNPNPTKAIVLLTFNQPGGGTYQTVIRVQPNQRLTLHPDLFPNFAFTEFSATIESDFEVVVDRHMTWDRNVIYGSHAETAVAARSTIWYLAEGSTSDPFSLFYLLQNPHNEVVTATIRYLRPFGLPPITRGYTLPPLSRTTIPVDLEAPELRGTDLSAIVEASQQIVVERAMYMDQPGAPPFNAGHESAGVTAPATEWFLAEGATGPFFEMFVLIANPNPEPAQVQVDYLLLDGSPLTKIYDVPALGRYTIWVDEEQIPAGSGQKPLRNVAVSTRVRSLNNMPIIVERAMWWPQPVWHEGHNSPGTTKSGTKWALAEGEEGGGERHETYILVANVSDYAGQVKVTLYFEDGSPAQSRTYDMQALRRMTVRATTDFSIPTDKRFSAVIESLGTSPIQTVVERAMYGSGNGQVWGTGTNAVGTRLQP